MQLNFNAPLLERLEPLLELLQSELKLHMMIAGGCIRDSLLSRPVSDIDVFVQARKDRRGEIPSALARLAKKHGITYKALSEDHQEYDNSFNVYNVNWPGYNQVIQIVSVSDLQHHLESFSVNLSKVRFDSNGLELTTEFMYDAVHDMITLSPNFDFSLKGHKLYLEKIMRKYPSFKVNKMVKQIQVLEEVEA